MNLYGASGHAKVIVEIICSNNGNIDNIIDDNPLIKEILGIKVIHSPSEDVFDNKKTLVAIGNNRTRKKIALSLRGKVHPFIFHPSAVISPSAKIGEGTVIMAQAAVNPEAVIGEHCIINTGGVVEHDVEMEDFVHLSPNASVAGNVKIGEGTHIGTGAAVIPGVKIGRWVIVGAGAIIIEDVPDFATVVGNPARIVRIDQKSGE